MKQLPILLFGATLLCLAPHAAAQQTIVAASRGIDWGNVGIDGGIPARTTICATLEAGATATQINGALASCPAGQTVMLNAGTYNIMGGIDFGPGKSGVTLRGAGADRTFLVFSSGLSCNGLSSHVCMHSIDTNWRGGPSNTANWTAGYARGTTVITLSNTTNLAVGKTIILDQLNDTSDDGSIYVCDTVKGNCNDDGPSGGPSGAQRESRGQQQLVTVTAIDGNQVTISPGLYMPNWRASQSPGAWWPTSAGSGVGLENLSLDHTASAARYGIAMFNCHGCWATGVRSVRADRAHVHIELSSRAVIRDSYFYGTKNAVSQSYGIETFPSGDSLFENNIFQQVTAPQTINGPCSGCVVAYNFSIYNRYNPATYLSHSVFLHSSGIDNMLIEGNVGAGMYSDLFHGTHHFVTVFRNRYNGWESTGAVDNLNAEILRPFSRFFNIVGNVLGENGRQTHYQRTPGTGGEPAIYVLGTGAVNCCFGGDAAVASTLMRWGNYDTVTGGVRFLPSEVPSALAGVQSPYSNPVPGTQTLPASLYLSARPRWWPNDKPWPAIGPDVIGGNLPGVGGHAYSIPAQDCYLTHMAGPANGAGGPLSFNAATCYPVAAPLSPSRNRQIVGSK